MSDAKKCPHCGKLIHSGAQYCMFCMTSLVAKQDITPTVHKPRNAIAIGVLLLIPAVLLLVLYLIADPTAPPAEQMPPALEHTEGFSQPSDVHIDPTGDQPPLELPSFIPTVTPTPPAEKPTEKETTPTGKSETPTETSPNQPPAQTQPQCSHNYTPASCVAPMTCKTCGDTAGFANASAHTWQPVYDVVHHDQVGHYKTTEIQRQKTVYLCFFCSYNDATYDSLDALRAHISVHSGASNYNYVISRSDLLADTRQVWVTEYEQQWVVDQEAYDETVITEYTCTLCGSKKDP